MTFTEKAIDEFLRIWKAEFKEELSADEARVHAIRLMTLFRVLARPLPREIAAAREKRDAALTLNHLPFGSLEPVSDRVM